MSAHRQSRHQRSRRVGLWLGLALLIHAEALLVLGVMAYLWAPSAAEMEARRRALAVPESIDIATLDEGESRKILAEMERMQEKREEQKIEEELNSPRPPGQVVDMARPVEEKRPEDARFAAEFDASVDRETKHHGKFNPESRAGADRGASDTTSQAQRGMDVPQAGQGKKGLLAMRSESAETPPQQPGDPTVREQPLVHNRDGALPRTEARPTQAPGLPPSEAPPQGLSPDGPLAPSFEQLARAIGSGTEDYLRDVEEGEITSLNSKKWRFATFFNRVKDKVRDHWDPNTIYRRRDPSGSIYGNKDRYTLLRVQLKPDGSLANVRLEMPSGVDFLDDEAIDAFKEAEPFPNPPHQLVDRRSGLIDFQFGFFFDLSEEPRMRVFRY